VIIKYKSAKITQPCPGVTRRVLAHSPSLMLAEHTLEKGAVLPEHSHPHQQMVFLRTGKLMVEMGGQTIEIDEGDSFVISPDARHKVTALEYSVAMDIFTPAREDYL
jgi:quercetin dioxygenase-like cupin family protein